MPLSGNKRSRKASISASEAESTDLKIPRLTIDKPEDDESGSNSDSNQLCIDNLETLSLSITGVGCPSPLGIDEVRGAAGPATSASRIGSSSSHKKRRRATRRNLLSTSSNKDRSRSPLVRGAAIWVEDEVFMGDEADSKHITPSSSKGVNSNSKTKDLQKKST